MIEVTLPTFIAIIAATVLVILFLIIFLFKRSGRKDLLDYEFLKHKEADIEKLVNGNSESEYTLALIEADKLLDHFLKIRHFAGNTLGERLKLAGYKYPALRKVWPAHKMRNRIVHESSVKISANEVKSYWRDYKNSYKILSR